jgi:aspartyl-tRNA(Asn)/glutamyl-tRNA(Gln) amidotransferase subunit A
LFRFHSIKDYHKALQNGQTTCVEAVRFYIAAIRQQTDLNAFIEVYETEALEQAALLDQQRSESIAAGLPLAPLHGVVTGLKDVISYKGHQLSAASKILSNFTAVYHSTATQRLLDAGAIIIGRQNCDEFAMGSSNENSSYGPVKNARDTERVSGGSSGGSAVSVQAALCMISLGSDTGGSVRQPADFCGIIGIKPTYGRISRYGLIAYASSFDQIGIFTATIADAALVLRTIAGEDEFDSTVSTKPVPDYLASLEAAAQSDIKKYRIAYFKESMEHPALDEDIRQKTLAKIQQMKEAGYTVEPVNFDLLEYVVPTYYVLTTAEASSNLSRYDGVRYGLRTAALHPDLTTLYKASRSEGFGEEVKRRILLGTFVLSEGYFDAYFTKAQQVRQLLKTRTEALFAEYDAIISPTVPATAFKIGEKSDDPIEMFLADIYTVYPNLVGIPAISIPLFTHSNGMPFGLQIMTKHFDEENLLQLSAQLMQLK